MVKILKKEKKTEKTFLSNMNSYTDWAPVFGADTRRPQSAKASKLRSLGAPATSYGLAKGDKLTFDKKYKSVDDMDDDLQVQPGMREGSRPVYLAPCFINGVKTWINPMFFLRNQRVNNRNTPVYPAWAALGDAYTVLDQLIKQGGIEIPVDDGITVQVAAYDPTNGQPAYLTNMVDGKAVRIRATEERNYPNVPDPIKG